MSFENFYMILQVDLAKNTVLLEEPLLHKQVVVSVSKEYAEMYEELLEKTAVNESLPFVKYDEERCVICNGL